MGDAAYKKKVQVSDDAGVTWYDLPAISPNIEIGGDVIDDTSLIEANAGFRSRIYGLIDWSVGADGKFVKPTGTQVTDDASGATGLIKVREAKLNRTALKVRYLPTGAVDSSGLVGDCVVETYRLSGDASDKVNVAISLQADGAIAAAA